MRVLFLLGLPADTLSGHRDRFYMQYRTYVLVAVVIKCIEWMWYRSVIVVQCKWISSGSEFAGSDKVCYFAAEYLLLVWSVEFEHAP